MRVLLLILAGLTLVVALGLGLGRALASDVAWQIERDRRVCARALNFAASRRDSLDVIVKLEECR